LTQQTKRATHITTTTKDKKMNTTRISTLRTKIRNMGYALAQAEMRGLGGKGLFSQKLAHNLLLSELYLLEKRV
jgi:hypothetical protein